MRRAGLAVVATLLTLSGTAGPAAAQPGTEVINVVAVDPDGKPMNGYWEPQTPVPPESGTSGCTASPFAVGDDIYACSSPPAAAAYVCWQSPPNALLCLPDVWSRQLHRLAIGEPLPPVTAPADPQPFALELDDGAHCYPRWGGGWAGRDDGYDVAYRCGSQAVLNKPGQPAVDRAAPSWKVQVGAVGPGATLPPPTTRTVHTAWFAGLIP